MSRSLIAVVLVPVLFLLPALAQPAVAHGGGFSLGGWFSVGGVSFSLVFGAPSYGGPPGYYYRTPASFGVRGIRCTDRCFRRGGYVYHDPSCPVVGRYFDRYGVQPGPLFEGYAPPPVWGGAYYDEGYYGGVYGNRYDRYNRYDRNRGYGGYGRYDRYRGYGRYDRYRGYDRYDRYHRRGHDGRYGSRRDRARDYGRYGTSRHHRGRGDRYEERYRGRGRGHSSHGHGRGHDGRHQRQ